jgi:hypothetical protein
LCDRCLQYETNIEWKIINEVIKWVGTNKHNKVEVWYSKG